MNDLQVERSFIQDLTQHGHLQGYLLQNGKQVAGDNQLVHHEQGGKHHEVQLDDQTDTYEQEVYTC